MLSLLYLLSFACPAYAAPDLFRDAVNSYMEMRIAEENWKLEKLSKETDEEKLQKLSNELTQKRIEFNTMVKTEQKEYLPWQKQIFAKGKALPYQIETIEYLSKNFTEARNYSPFQWRVLHELFGSRNQEAFFKISQKVEEIGTGSLKDEEKQNVIVVYEPFARVFAKSAPMLAENDPIVIDLKKNGHNTETLQLSAYPKIDDQADELYRLLIERTGEPTAIVTSNESSAVMLRCLDLHPDLRKSKKITGWVNLNGKLYGFAPEEKGRKIASVKAATPMEQIENEAKVELHLLFRESLTVSAPLGKGFPILNILNATEKNSLGNLGEAVVPGAKTYWLQGKPSVSGAIPLLRGPASTEALKDTPAELY